MRSYVQALLCGKSLLLCGITFLSLLASPLVLLGQSADSQGCFLKEPPLTANRPNLFNDQQEQWLGDIMAGQEESGYDLLPEQETQELTRIGQKLLAQLPPTPIHYRFRVYDSDELNGFSLAGGYVYLSRKIIIDAKSEDEVAGILAHEIGHIYTHQIATTITRSFDKMLHVASVGDRDDVFDKYQRMLNAPWKSHSDLDEDEAEKDEMRADAVGLYAMVRAGYAPQGLPNDLERIANSKGKNGNFLSDILGGSSVEGMRVRAARKLVNATSDTCKQHPQSSSSEFLEFQKSLVSHPASTVVAATDGLHSIELSNAVRPGLNWVRFSPDGKYVLAQNESYIHVLASSPLKELFSVYAPGASEAHFTPDSQRLVFHYQSLRVEEWDVASAKMLGAHELVEYQGCWQSELSPDGRLLACVFRNREDLQLSLEIFDVSSGKVVWSKGDGFVPDERARLYKITTRPDWDPEVLAITFSPDSHFMVIAGQANNLALDLRDLKPVKMNMELGHIVQGRLAFTAPDQILYDCDAGENQIFRSAQSSVCVADFPSGVSRLKFVEGWESMVPVSQGNLLIGGTIFDSIPHLIDLTTGKPGSPLKFQAADVYGKLLATESVKGGVTVGEIGAAKVDSAELPAMPLPYVRVARFSEDGRYLAISNENRGAIWDLSTNHQIALTRSFRGAWFDGTGQLYLQFPAGQARLGQNLSLNLSTGAVSDTGKYERDVRQHLDVRVDADWLDQEKIKGDELAVYDAKTGAPLWKRHFSKDAPRISQQQPGVLTFTWSMDGETAWDEILHTSVLTKTADENREEHQGVLTELVDSHTGQVLRRLMSPEGSLNGWGKNPGAYVQGRDARNAHVYGDLVAVHGNDNNTVVYNAKTGARLMAFWGSAIAGSSELGWIAATNHDQEVVAYDVATGKELLHVTVDHPVRAAQFVADKRRLLVLTNSQRVYTLEPATAPAKTGGADVQASAKAKP